MGSSLCTWVWNLQWTTVQNSGVGDLHPFFQAEAEWTRKAMQNYVIYLEERLAAHQVVTKIGAALQRPYDGVHLGSEQRRGVLTALIVDAMRRTAEAPSQSHSTWEADDEGRRYREQPRGARHVVVLRQIVPCEVTSAPTSSNHDAMRLVSFLPHQVKAARARWEGARLFGLDKRKYMAYFPFKTCKVPQAPAAG